jgi:hypothetical protein
MAWKHLEGSTQKNKVTSISIDYLTINLETDSIDDIFNKISKKDKEHSDLVKTCITRLDRYVFGNNNVRVISITSGIDITVNEKDKKILYVDLNLIPENLSIDDKVHFDKEISIELMMLGKFDKVLYSDDEDEVVIRKIDTTLSFTETAYKIRIYNKEFNNTRNDKLTEKDWRF